MESRHDCKLLELRPLFSVYYPDQLKFHNTEKKRKRKQSTTKFYIKTIGWVINKYNIRQYTIYQSWTCFDYVIFQIFNSNIYHTE